MANLKIASTLLSGNQSGEPAKSQQEGRDALVLCNLTKSRNVRAHLCAGSQWN